MVSSQLYDPLARQRSPRECLMDDLLWRLRIEPTQVFYVYSLRVISVLEIIRPSRKPRTRKVSIFCGIRGVMVGLRVGLSTAVCSLVFYGVLCGYKN
mgnify:CR=1 FL=1